ncbi:metallo-beta-lactamase family protein [Terriglobus saanensis SP1PR4]|uniref:Metallo-beta-lactamase family protein n=2 Tax=Terriglobus saanensis TaxID=870903 RepID=E8V828_TERSS|nr:metallo-beta-lactamase family protein [Terriglobus saanensis SP1PR4]
MRMTVLASGSKGNSAVVSSSGTRILVDAGLSCRELMRRMAMVGENPETLDAILITHEHADHVAGLPVLARKFGIPVYFTEATHRAWVRQVTPQKRTTYAQWLEQRKAEMALRDEELVRSYAANACGAPNEAPDEHFFVPSAESMSEGSSEADKASEEHNAVKLAAAAAEDLCDEADAPAVKKSVKDNPSYLPVVEYFRAGSHLAIGDIDILPFTIPHDAADPCGFVFEAEGIRLGFATDLGYVPQNVKMALKNCDALLLESNHDLEMLRDGPYPWSVKQRVLSRVGHLSNTATAEFLTRDYDGGAAYVILAHLSESNNLPEMARLAAEQAIGDRLSLLGNKILLAQQAEPMQPLCL